MARGAIAAPPIIAAPPPQEQAREYERLHQVWAIFYVVFGVVVACVGLSIVAAGLLGPASSDSDKIIEFGGGVITTGSMGPFTMSWLRSRHAASVKILMGLWSQAFETGDPLRQIPSFNERYQAMVGIGPKPWRES